MSTWRYVSGYVWFTGANEYWQIQCSKQYMRLCASFLRTKSLCDICDSSAHCSLVMDVLGVSGFLIALTLSSKVDNAFVYKRNKSS